MVHLDELAVGHTLTRLHPVLPPPPARVLEAGCGRGVLAAALGTLGYRVTGVDPDEDACAAAAARGVNVVHAGVADVEVEDGSGYDVVLFTRSLHHVEELDATLAHAVGLVRPGGLVVLEEFARERADQLVAGFLYDTHGLLVAAGALRTPEGVAAVDPDEDPAGRFERERGTAAETPLHTGAAMLAALARAGAVVESDTATETLWRMVAAPGTTWQLDDGAAGALVEFVRRVECRRIAEGTLPAVGMIVAARAR